MLVTYLSSCEARRCPAPSPVTKGEGRSLKPPPPPPLVVLAPSIIDRKICNG